MHQATFAYRRNENPHRMLALTGAIFFLKMVLLIPHLMIVSALNGVGGTVAYVGYWLVAITGEMPSGIRELLTMTLRWQARAYAWLGGLVDTYPPFELDPDGYPDAVMPENPAPSQGWAIAGIFFFVKALAAIPHFVALVFLGIGAFFVAWFGYFQVLFTGRLSDGVQDYLAGVIQWGTRVTAWFWGLTDEYPPFELDARPAA